MEGDDDDEEDDELARALALSRGDEDVEMEGDDEGAAEEEEMKRAGVMSLRDYENQDKQQGKKK
ncbi:hypothetical protein BT69DRAFT_1337153 [Atractiella rhizophila]|nr:hypothetical protein BT69DRAFT_1337153 [Atractiella rhizophila]